MSPSTTFCRMMIEETAALRAFGRALARDRELAEDLTQEALLRALLNHEKFRADSDMRAWLFTILRNAFLSGRRRRRHEVQDVDGAAAARLACPPTQELRLLTAELRAALDDLPAEQRRALLLIGVDGLGYAEAADLCGCPAGTVKSRVARARARLAATMQVRSVAELVADPAMPRAVAAGRGAAAADS